jgi:hypothetical protein
MADNYPAKKKQQKPIKNFRTQKALKYSDLKASAI